MLERHKYMTIVLEKMYIEDAGENEDALRKRAYDATRLDGISRIVYKATVQFDTHVKAHEPGE